MSTRLRTVRKKITEIITLTIHSFADKPLKFINKAFCNTRCSTIIQDAKNYSGCVAILYD